MRDKVIEKHNISGGPALQRFRADKKTISLLDSMLQKNDTSLAPYREKISEYKDILTEFKLRDHLFYNDAPSISSVLIKILGYICAAPFYWYGIITHIIPYKLTERITSSRIKDSMFHPTVKFGLGIILFPIWWLILTAVVWMKFSGWTAFIFIVSLPLFGKFSFWLYQRMKKLTAYIRFRGLKNNEDIKRAHQIREEIIDAFISEV